MDSLSELLQDLDLNAEVFFSGSLCGLQAFDAQEKAGQLHFLKSGTMVFTTDQGHRVVLNRASVIFLPEGGNHHIQVEDSHEAELVCASIKFQPHQKAALVDNLPKFLFIDVEEDPEVSRTAKLIFNEAFTEKQGRQLVINRLCDVFMVQILRHVMVRGTLELSLLAGSAHPSLAPLIKSLQERPEDDWTVEGMAERVAMSRSKFAALFKETLGKAPMDYVTDLRLAMAKGLLQKNRPVGLVANDVGYDNASSLARVFKKRLGKTPKQWLKERLLP